MSTAALLDQITRAVAILRSAQYKRPLRIRMHPLDIAYLGRDQAPKGTVRARVLRIAGINVEPDCAVTRGRPEVEYE